MRRAEHVRDATFWRLYRLLAVGDSLTAAHLGRPGSATRRLVVIDADLLNAPDEELLTMGDRVVLTVVGGKVEFARDGFELPRAER